MDRSFEPSLRNEQRFDLVSRRVEVTSERDGWDVNRKRGRSQYARRVVVATLILAGCSSGGITSSSLVDYATGPWSCVFTSSTASLGNSSVDISATVSATNSTRGMVRLELHGPGGVSTAARLKDVGRWSLQGDALTVRWDRKALGPVHAQSVSLNGKEFRIRGGTRHPARRGDWVGVTVNRTTRAATFAFTMPGSGEPGSLTCTKD